MVSKDADFDLVSAKILNYNNGPMGWGPGPMGWGPGPGKRIQKHPHLWRSSWKTPH